MNPLFDDVELVDAGLEALKGRPGVPGGYLEFHRKLHHTQTRAFRTVLDDPGSGDNAMVDLCAGVKIAFAGFGDSGDGELRRLADAVAADPSGLGVTVMNQRGLPSKESLETPLDVSAGAAIFLGRILRAPFSSRDAALSRTEHGRILDPGCPWCGALPGLSILSAPEGRRILVCGECGMEWEFPRFKCPHCGSDKDLGVLKENRDAPRWLETCETCRGAVKVVDGRMFEKGMRLLPLVESIAGLYLDLIAEKHGHSTGTPYAAIR